MVELALLGGPPAVTVRPRPVPSRDPAAVRAVVRALAEGLGGGICGAGVVAELEEAFKAVVGTRYALAVSSGTAALYLALRACGVGAGAEVILSAYDWGAAVAAVRAAGARPVFADIDPRTYTLDPGAVKKLLSPRTRAVVATHIFGHPAALAELLGLARALGIPLIEDCAQGLGARYRGRPVGSFGDAACFSLGPGKAVSAGEGGILATDDEGIYLRAVGLSQHPLRQLREGLRPNPFGLNFRMNPLGAALALARLRGLKKALKVRRERVRRLEGELSRVGGIRPVFVAPGCEHAYHRYSPTYAAEEWAGVPRDLAVEALAAEGVPIVAGFIERPLYRHLRGYRGPVCPAAEARCREQLGLWIPEGPDEAEFEAWVGQVGLALAKVYGARARLAGLG
jgi:dTDP-4-amino-4,6-dideoxygalactose transaminase